MPRILVPPEVLIRVSEEAARAAGELETTKNRLDQQITYMMSSWEGTTRSRFFEDFQRAHGEETSKASEKVAIVDREAELQQGLRLLDRMMNRRNGLNNTVNYLHQLW